MKKFSLFLLACLTLLAPALRAADQTFGAGIKEAETTSVAKILANPDAYVGKTVRIEGKVTDVCPMKGCWMELEEQGGANRMRVRVEDGVIVFPVDAKGKSAVAEGKLEAISMDRERYVGWLQHLAEEQGKTFDASTVGDGPFRIFELRATGAKVEG